MSQEIENQIPAEQEVLVVQANNDDVLEQEVVVLQKEQDEEEDHNKEHDEEEEQSDDVLEPERQDEQEQLKIADRHDRVSTSSNSGAADTSVPAETRSPQEQRLHRQLVVVASRRDRGIITTINVTMNVVAGSLRFIASIFFISAAVHFHYNMWDNTNIQNTGDKQGALFMTGFVFLGAAFVLEFYYITKSENQENHMLFMISMFSVFLLFIGSVFPLISTVNDPDVFAGFFIVGSLILGSCQALELSFYLRRDDDGTTTNKIMITSMTLAVLGSFFFFLGGVFFTEKVVLDEYYFYKAIERHAALFIVGGMAYMFHAICYLIDTTQQEST